MTVTTESVEALMKRCQRGVGGRDALNQAHDIMAECYGTLGALVQARDRAIAAVAVATQTLCEYESREIDAGFLRGGIAADALKRINEIEAK